MKKIASCDRTLDQIKIQTHSAPQNDRLNFSFVKDTYYVDGEKLARNGHHWLVSEILAYVQSLFCHDRLGHHETSKIG